MRLYGPLVFQQAFCTPKFLINLLFMNQLIKDLHCRVIFDLGSCIFHDLSNGKMIGGGREQEGIYYQTIPMENVIFGTPETYFISMAPASWSSVLKTSPNSSNNLKVNVIRL